MDPASESQKRAPLEPIAVVGMAYNFPQGASCDNDFWSMLMKKQCASTKFPKDRINIDAFHSIDGKRLNQISTEKANFLKEDIRNFDAQFFRIPLSEAGSMDPQHRMLMETTYHALENAGIRLDDIAGSRTSVHVGCFTSDYTTYLWRDTQKIPKYSSTGGAQSILSNRLSWFFGLHGSSMTIDTACSSSMVALDLACKGLWNGSSDMAIVGGANLILSPELNIALSNMGFLSPDGQCFSFDDRANGYARGEGFAVLVLQRLSSVVQGHPVRALVRSIATNEDGYTPGGITQPSKEMQAQLIRETYNIAGLDMKSTAYFEAHGTGTVVGDPIEAAAIGECFGRYHSPENPLYVGAVKSNIGHLEGTSGLAGVVKTILALERAMIPPNANFERVNPNIDSEFFNLKFPTMPVHWPKTGLRRASVNSFGFGGSNAHVVLDAVLPSYGSSVGSTTKVVSSDLNCLSGELNGKYIESGSLEQGTFGTRLVIYSSSDDKGIVRQAGLDEQYFEEQNRACSTKLIDDFCYTRNCGRTLFQWRSFAVINEWEDLRGLATRVSTPMRHPNRELNLGFVFTGQGAQWVGMGKELFQYSAFSESIGRSEVHLRSQSCDWNLREILTTKFDDMIFNDPKYSQPLTTILQIGIVDLLNSVGIVPYLVVGHSSGEIAAAYTAGYISHFSAIAVSFHRGQLASDLISNQVKQNSMMAVGLSASEAQDILNKMPLHSSTGFNSSSLTISCINSHGSVTVSGPNADLDHLAVELKTQGIFHRKLRVGLGYHSPQMDRIAEEYKKRLGNLEQGLLPGLRRSVMVSSVTGNTVSADVVSQAQYWVDNMVLPVNFLGAAEKCCATSGSEDIVKKLDRSHARNLVTHGIIEIGPHAALGAPIQEILGHHNRTQEVTYCSALIRNRSATDTILRAIGTLFCAGFDVDLSRITSLCSATSDSPTLLMDLPPYSFDHSVLHWEESQKNVDFRLRKHPNHDLLGSQIEWNPLESIWRLIIREDELPWIKDHKVHDAVLYPAAGMLAMAIEAAKQQLFDKPPLGFELENVEFVTPILISSAHALNGVEVQTTLSSASGAEGKRNSDFKFRIFLVKPEGAWEEVCFGKIRADYGRTVSDVDNGRESSEKTATLQSNFVQACQTCVSEIESAKFYESIRKDGGIEYGPSFQRLDDIHFNKEGEAFASLRPYGKPSAEYTIHPAFLDAMFQLGFAALTGGNFTNLPTMVPRRMGRLWISFDGAGRLDSPKEQLCTQSRIFSSRTAVANVSAFSGDDLRLITRIEDLEITAVSSPEDPKTLDDAEHCCHHMEWKVDLDRLTGEETRIFLEEARGTAFEPRASEWAANMDILMLSFATMALEEVRASQRPIVEPLREHALWLEERLDDFHRSLPEDGVHPILLGEDQIRSMYDKVLPSAVAKLFILVGEHLTRLLLGDVDPLQLLFEEDEMMADFFTELISRATVVDPIQRYIDCLVHKSPALNFLEVGAGTGASSAVVLGVMDNLQDGTRFESYTFTDISPSFFEKARVKLQAHEHRMKFKVLNIEQDPAAQGFAEEQYDVVVADNVLHATTDLEVVLGNLRKLLKPGGKLLLKEMTAITKVITGFYSGLLPGWWRSKEDYRIRQRSPAITEVQWDQVLKKSGFTGVEFALRDFADDRCYSWSFMVSSLSPKTDKGLNGVSDVSVPLILFDSTSKLQTQVAKNLCLELNLPESNMQMSGDLDSKEVSEPQDYLILNGLNESLLWELSSPFLQTMQDIVSKARNIWWIGGGGESFAKSPKFGIVNGLARVIRQEHNSVNVVHLALDLSPSAESLTESAIRHIASVVQADGTEPEYALIQNRLCVNRLVTARSVDQHIFSQLEQPVITQPIGEKNLRLGVRTPGLLDTTEFREQEEDPTPLGADEVIIEVRALGVNFKDCLTMLGRVDTDIMGSECVGVIREAGSNAGFNVGDRVVAGALDSYRTIVRIGKEMVVRIPDEMSFIEAASFPTAFCTALYSLIHVARLQRGETILIHAASGGTGQAAVQTALRAGAEVFATVGSASKKTLLMERYGVLEDHIFYSRDESFADGIKRVTKGRGVDVVLNSVSGKLLEASWDCVAPFGRFIEIGRKDVDSRGHLPMYPFIRNLSFSGVDLTMVLEQNIQLGHRLISEVMSLAETSQVKPVYPIHTYQVTEAEQAFRFMQSGKSSGKIVLQIDKSHVVPTVLVSKRKHRFSENATYVIAGGLGGVGRRIARWLVEGGAKHLILLSRSGVSGDKKRTDLIDELQAAGIEVKCPGCDISNVASLQLALEVAQDMPPIRGCFHAAMTIRDAAFENMSIDDWRHCTLPKIQGSWNLHLLLPSGMDFFILLSSACGIFGNAGQGSYAAGNTFLDALAQYRVANGEKAVALDLGMLLQEGYVAENEQVQTRLLRMHILAPMSLDKLFAMFDYYCNPEHKLQARHSQLCSGYELPVNSKKKGLDVHTTMLTPLFRHMHQIKSSDQIGTASGTQAKNFRNLFIEASTSAEATSVAAESLRMKLSRVLGLPVESIELDRKLESYGVDSLVALELRNWMTKEMGADVAVFELLGGTSLKDIGRIMAMKSTLRGDRA